MITPNELRIGNWIYNPVQKINFQVDIRTLINIENDLRHNTTKDISKFMYQPIPLTEEILEKCGFIKHETLIINLYNMNLSKLIGFKELSVTIQQGNQYIFFKEYDKQGDETPSDLVCLRDFDSHGLFMLHQLQNLYFTLTGKELEVKL